MFARVILRPRRSAEVAAAAMRLLLGVTQGRPRGFNSIIANDNVKRGARASVTVKRGAFFKSKNCGTWTTV